MTGGGGRVLQGGDLRGEILDLLSKNLLELDALGQGCDQFRSRAPFGLGLAEGARNSPPPTADWQIVGKSKMRNQSYPLITRL